MSVDLFASETLGGPAYNDELTNTGGSKGVAMGKFATGSYTPVVVKTNNTGHKDFYLSHNGVAKISNVLMFLQEFGVGTLFAYGGDALASTDYSNVINLGSSSGASKNNLDGLSGGLWVDFDAFIGTVSQFDAANRPDFVKIFGKSDLGDGLDNAQDILKESMVWDDSTIETVASAPVDNEIGEAGNTVLGEYSHLKFRFYAPTSTTFSGVMQFEVVFAYSFTS